MKTAIMLNAPINEKVESQIQAGAHPRVDYRLLADALDATVVAPPASEAKRRSKLSKISAYRRVAAKALEMSRDHDLIITDVDRVGLLTALVFKVRGVRARHIVICHGKMADPKDLRALKALKLHKNIDRFVCYGPMVAQRLRDTLGLDEDRVTWLRHPADHLFWRPQPAKTERLIVGAGNLYRDYKTLIEAVRGLDVQVVLAAHSPWVTNGAKKIDEESAPPNVTFGKFSPHELRDLYSRAMCIAAPLIQTPTQAGSLVVYEGLAMGKPVLLTGTDGQRELRIVEEGETGRYLGLHDVAGWRDAIQGFLDHPEEAERMGRRAREVVESGMNMDAYVRQMLAIVESMDAGRVPAIASTFGERRRDAEYAGAVSGNGGVEETP